MILSDKTIKDLIDKGSLKIENVDKLNIECASVDLTLGNSAKILRPLRGVDFPNLGSYRLIKLDEPNKYEEIGFTEDSTLVLPPKAFILATTNEKITLPKDVGAFVTGRSSIGRLGLFVENAGWVDPNFTGQITLELFNATDYYIELEAGRRIAQLVFVQLDQECENPYNGKYQNQLGVTGSKIEQDIELPKRINHIISEVDNNENG